MGSALQCIRPILDRSNRIALLRWTRQGLKAEALSVPQRHGAPHALMAGRWGWFLSDPQLTELQLSRREFALCLPLPFLSNQLSWRTGPEFAPSTLLVASIKLTHIIIALES